MKEAYLVSIQLPIDGKPENGLTTYYCGKTGSVGYPWHWFSLISGATLFQHKGHAIQLGKALRSADDFQIHRVTIHPPEV